jgi:hypothetical protein
VLQYAPYVLRVWVGCGWGAVGVRLGCGCQTTTAVITRATAAVIWGDQRIFKRQIKNIQNEAARFKRAASAKYKNIYTAVFFVAPAVVVTRSGAPDPWGLANTHWYCRGAALKWT